MASNTTFIVRKESGKFIDRSRKLFKEQFDLLTEDGNYKVQVKKVSDYLQTTRYKYYFDGLLNSIFEYGKTRYAIIENGEIRDLESTQELHECIKLEFNSVCIINKKTSEITKTATSTTNLSDRDFIGQFMETIIMTFMQDYNDIEIMDYETWRAEKKKIWDARKVK